MIYTEGRRRRIQRNVLILDSKLNHGCMASKDGLAKSGSLPDVEMQKAIDLGEEQQICMACVACITEADTTKLPLHQKRIAIQYQRMQTTFKRLFSWTTSGSHPAIFREMQYWKMHTPESQATFDTLATNSSKLQNTKELSRCPEVADRAGTQVSLRTRALRRVSVFRFEKSIWGFFIGIRIFFFPLSNSSNSSNSPCRDPYRQFSF